jgi:hypothetical protein
MGPEHGSEIREMAMNQFVTFGFVLLLVGLVVALDGALALRAIDRLSQSETTNQTNGPPPSNPPSLDHAVALFSQSIAAGFSDQQQHGVMSTNLLSQIVTNVEQFLANPHHG